MEVNDALSKPQYKKIIGLSSLRGYEITYLEDTIKALGFKNLVDYKFNHFGIGIELLVLNKSLNRYLKAIKKIKFNTKVK